MALKRPITFSPNVLPTHIRDKVDYDEFPAHQYYHCHTHVYTEGSEYYHSDEDEKYKPRSTEQNLDSDSRSNTPTKIKMYQSARKHACLHEPDFEDISCIPKPWELGTEAGALWRQGSPFNYASIRPQHPPVMLHMMKVEDTENDNNEESDSGSDDEDSDDHSNEDSDNQSADHDNEARDELEFQACIWRSNVFRDPVIDIIMRNANEVPKGPVHQVYAYDDNDQHPSTQTCEPFTVTEAGYRCITCKTIGCPQGIQQEVAQYRHIYETCHS
jgi:hypothetical protein